MSGGRNLLSKILKGSKEKKILELGLEEKSLLWVLFKYCVGRSFSKSRLGYKKQ